MIYHLKTKNKRQKILIAFILILVFVGLMRLIFPSTWSYIVINSSRPFLNISHIFFTGPESEELQKQVNDLKLQANDRNILASENTTLKEILGRGDQRNTILAVVISKPTYTPFDTFLIDIGSNNGLQVGNEVLAGSSTAIGIVTEVFPKISKVTAYSSPDARHPVFVGEKNIQAEAIGQGNGNYKIVLPEGSEVKIGDAVIIPNIIPTIFGIVEKIVPSDQPSFINVLFKAPINLNELYYVQIIK